MRGGYVSGSDCLFRVPENEIQNKQARLLHIPFTLPCYSSKSPPPPFILLSLSPLTLFLLFFFLKPTGGYVVWNMLICHAPATPWVKITY